MSSSSNKRSNNNSSNTTSECAEDDTTVFDDSFVVRRKQAAPEGEDESVGGRHSGGGKNREELLYTDNDDDHDDDEDDRYDNRHGDDDDDDGGASLADLTTSYGSGVELHPHHKNRRDRPSSEHVRRPKSSSMGRGGEAREHARRHRKDDRESSRRRKHTTTAHYEDEDFWSEGGDSRSVPRSDDNIRSSSRHRHNNNGSVSSSRSNYHGQHGGGSNRSSMRGRRSPNGGGICGPFSRLYDVPILGTILSFFDGVNVKTVLLCVLGMTMVMKLNSNYPPPPTNSNHGITTGGYNANDGGAMNNDPATVSPGVRGAMLNEDGEGDGEGGERGSGEYEGAAFGGEDGGIIAQDPNNGQNAYASALEDRGQQQPPPPPTDPGQQQQHQYLLMQQQQQQQLGALNPAAPQQFDPQQQAQQQQYAPPPQQQLQQQGYFVQQQQQPLQQGAIVGDPSAAGGGATPQQQQQPQQPNVNSYAVGQTSTYNQSPLEWQQQQMAAQQVQGGQAVVAEQVAVQQQLQFGSAVDASLMSPPQNIEVVDATQPVADGAAAEAAPPTEVAADQVPLVPPPAPPSGDSVLGLLDNFKDSWDPYDETSTPMFWHIPKAGGSSIKDAMGGCHRFVQATEFGVTDGHDADTEVAIVYPSVPGVADTDRSPFVNIDSTTVAGIARAKSLGFADAQLAQVVVSPFVFETNDLFTQTAKGRLFSVFRHPIDRAVSMFYYIRVADWEPSYAPEMKDWTLEQYASSDRVENNWMTRQLSNQLGGELTEDNLRKAMEVVQTKFMVGLMSKIEPTMSRFEKFFRWTYHVNPPNQERCRERLMSGGANSNKANKKPLAEGDPGWDLLAQQNNFDLRLYAYIETLFEEQGAFVADLPDEFRNVDATCCKCYPKTFPPEGFTCPEAVKNEG